MTVIRKALKIFWLTLVAIAAILFASALIIQTPKVQTALAGKVIDILDDKLDADIRFEKIHFQPFRTLIIKNIEIIDRNPVRDVLDPSAPTVDTLFRAEYIAATFSFESLFRQESIHLDEVTVSNAQMNLVLENNPKKNSRRTQTDNLSRIFRLVPPEEPQYNDKDIFRIRKVHIEDMGYAMRNHSSKKVPYHGGGINWDDLDVRGIKLEAEGLMFKSSVMYGEATHLSFREKSGYIMEKMTGSAKVGRGKTIIEDLHIDDPWSDLHLPLYMMSYKNIHAFQDFISQVRLDAEIADSRLNFKTLTYFVPELEGNSLVARISGKASGYVDDFNIMGIRMISEAGGFDATVDGRMTGIPEIENTSIDATISQSDITLEGLGIFLSEWMKEGEMDLSKYAGGHNFAIDASARGMLNSMDVHASLLSDIGGLKADMKIGGIISEDQPISLKGTASTTNLDLGEIISNDLFGPATLRTGIEAHLGERPNLKIDSLFIDRLNVNEYDYSGIKAVGALSDNMFNGAIIASDPNLNFILQGGFALSAKTQNALYKFYANVSDANLYALNIDKRGKSKLRFQTNVNFKSTGDGYILGNVDIANLIFENRDGTNRIGDINLTSHSNDDTYKIRLRSQFADGSFTGSAPVAEFIKDITDITVRKEVPALFMNPDFKWNGNSYSLDLNTHNSMDLLAFIMPGAYIHEGTRLNINVDKDGGMNASLSSQRLAIGDNFIKDVTLEADNLSDSFSGDITVDEMQFAGFKLAGNKLRFVADGNHLGASYSFANQDEQDTRGELVLNAGMSRENDRLDVNLNLLPSSLHFSSKEWRIQPSSLSLKGGNLIVDSLEVTSGDERIYAHGSTSMTQEDTLTLSLDRFDISILNPLLGEQFGLRGAATGNVRLTSPMTSRGLLADIICDSTFIAGEPLGTVTAGSAWNDDFKRFDIMLQNELEGKMNIDVNARLTPRSKMLDGTIRLDRLPVKYAEPILTEVFSEMGGYISGEIQAEGPLNMLEISSRNTRLEDVMLKVAFTNVPYYADGEFSIDEQGVYFRDISIRDRFNGTGTLGGSINWDRFQDIRFDTGIKVNAIEAVNLTKELSQDFYGHLFGTGNVSITGPVNSLTLSADVITAKTGQLHIPMSGAATSVGGTNLLKFKELKKEVYIDPYESMIAKNADTRDSNSNFFVNLRADVSPNVEAFVEIDEATGNVLSARGNGLIELEIGDDLFNINGTYTLTGGQYNFSALGLVSRQFEIQDGSSINFSGDIMASTLNIDALYITKTTLGALLADDNSVSNRRTVECGIQITDKLSNPRLAFSIDVPDLNPMVKSRVESALSTDDKVQKQFLSLLLSNSFLPDEQSGIANNTSMLYSNVSEAMANQLSNILHKLDIPLDLGLKYQPTEQGTDLFDVAVSTQLFNNRLVVNGNIGNKEYSSSGTQNDVVGDLDIEIKLDRSGAFRVNLFSHSADLYSNYLDNTQRNGVGLTYQTEFNNFRKFIRSIFSSKAKRQEARLAEEQEAINGEKVEMIITGEDYKKKRKKNE